MNAMLRADESVEIPIEAGSLEGSLTLFESAGGIVVFAHGSGSSRHSPRNQYVAEELHGAGLATLLFDLLTPEEHEVDIRTREYRFDIPRLAARLGRVADWVARRETTRSLPIGLFGASTGAAAALIAAAEHPDNVHAAVSRGGRPDLAIAALSRVQAPTMLIVGGLDEPVISMNRQAAAQMTAENRIEIVEGATHLFGEPGKLEEVARLASDWFAEKLMTRR